MNRKLVTSIVAIGICTCFFFLFGGTTNIRSEENSAESLAERPIFIADTDIFRELERPPVEFYHGKHALALEKEGCGVCHPQDKKGKFTFTYPKLRDDMAEQRLMNLYHDTCVGCHRERSKKGKASGFVTCGECHVVREVCEEPSYVPVTLDTYCPLEDVYHRDCIACHKEGEHVKKAAGPLNWKDFYVKQKAWKETDWPNMRFDYYLHHKHEEALEKRCELCHHMSDEKSSCRDCHREKEEDGTGSFRDVAHLGCITCHMERKKEGRNTGPFTCGGCHAEGKERPLMEIADILPPDGGQPGEVLISIEGARMKPVPFDHKAHEMQTVSCSVCHHEKLVACKECHTEKGSTEGGDVNLARAYHEVPSQRSCVGCHESRKSEPSCAGCHKSIEGGLNEASCLVCHSGASNGGTDVGNIGMIGAPDDILPEKLPEEITISILERDYMPANFPHRAIIDRLTDISNDSELARYFHTKQATICSGCHHYSPVQEKKQVPLCSACHSVRKEPGGSNIPSLLGAYHRQCLGCHKEMGIEPTGCTGCHAEKATAQAETVKK